MVDLAELAPFELLRDLPVGDLERLAAGAFVRHLDPGEPLFNVGEPAASMFGVQAGEIALRAATGERSTIVMTARSGELLGWSALREDARWLTTARAVGPTDVVIIPVETVLGLLGSGSEAARLLIRRLFGLAAAHLDETQAQLLRSGHEGPITGG